MVVSGTIALGHFDRVGLDLVAAMLAAGSLPDVIGDVHGLSINGPAFDQPVRLAEYFDSSGAGRESEPAFEVVHAADVSRIGTICDLCCSTIRTFNKGGSKKCRPDQKDGIWT
jgi:hypothetical protein